MTPARRYSVSDIALVVGAPLLLAIVELVHPQPHDLMKLDVRTWLAVHYAQIVLFPLSALAVAWWVKGQRGIAATVCRVALFVFAATWTAWDAVAGVATGILLDAAHHSGTPDAWSASIEAIWLHPIMGGTGAPLLAILGSVALSIGAVAAAVVLKRTGHTWAPIAIMVISTFGIAVFKTHAWPGGPLTFGGIAIAGAWLLRERASSAWRGEIVRQRVAWE
jgi:uncharacterized membrane protein YqjE